MEIHFKKLQFLTWAAAFSLIAIRPASAQPEPPSPTCSNPDRDALLAFKAAVPTDTTGFLATWTDRSNCCGGGWEGVACDTGGRVRSLVLQSPSPASYMAGPLSPSLGNLKFLEVLMITGMKRISGEIPESLSDLTHLTVLSLEDNALVGPIPSTFGRLKNLVAISLSGNHLTGRVPASFGSLSNLSQLSIARNFLTGPIPPTLGGLKRLAFLDLSFNFLSGPIPGFIGLQLRSLANLILTGNRFSGPIPDSLFGLTRLSQLSIDHNQLTGEIPARIKNLKSLAVLGLSSNKLTGPIPGSISELWKLWNLNLSRNSFSGPLPDHAFETGLPGLSSIDLSYNNLRLGRFPDWITRRELSDVRLAQCGLHGPLPNFTKPDSLNFIDLSHNTFTTGISTFLEKMTYLDTAIISNNLISCDLSSIRLPSQVSVLDLSSNRISGSLSRLLTDKHEFLEVIDLTKNSISGNIPDFSGQKFKVLNLGSNKIGGQIPVSVSKLVKLERFDVSRNRITGSIPPGLGSLGLRWLDVSVNRLIGRIPYPWPGSKTLSHVSFRANRLCGPIPPIRPFNVFPEAAYAHNLCLCGKPLKQLCRGRNK